QTLLWRSPQMQGGGADVEAADVDGDGKLDLVALGRSEIVIFSRDSTPNGYTEHFSAPVIENGVDLVVGDTDGDGTPEIYALVVPTLQTAAIQVFDNQLHLLRTMQLNEYVTSLSLEPSPTARKNLVLSVTGFNPIQFLSDK